MNPEILNIDGWMAPQELDWLYEIARRVPDHGIIVEIGAWKGRSSAALYEGAGNNKSVVSIDTWKGQLDLLHADHKEAVEKNIFMIYLKNLSNLGYVPQAYKKYRLGPQYLISDSVRAARLFDDKSVDVVFIDGDHTKAVEDIDAWLPKVKPYGVICGHDYFCFYESIQRGIAERIISQDFYIHAIIYSIWVHYPGGIPFWER